MEIVYRIIFSCFMFVLGAALGSFLCCQARRLRLREQGRSSPGPRSVCLHCHKKLAWYENLPLISWLVQRGKCKKCGKRIGLAEFLSELGSGLAFTLISFNFDLAALVTPSPEAPIFLTILSVATFIFTLILTALLIFLAIYDGLYGELPLLILTLSIICAIIVAIGHLAQIFSVSGFTPMPIYETLGSAAILGGTYLLLYLASKGKWVGSGDWLLGTSIGLALMSPWLSLLTLFLSNLLATLIMLPAAKRKQSHTIYFGPFLVAAYIIIYALSAVL